MWKLSLHTTFTLFDIKEVFQGCSYNNCYVVRIIKIRKRIFTFDKSNLQYRLPKSAGLNVRQLYAFVRQTKIVDSNGPHLMATLYPEKVLKTFCIENAYINHIN